MKHRLLVEGGGRWRFWPADITYYRLPLRYRCSVRDGLQVFAERALPLAALAGGKGGGGPINLRPRSSLGSRTGRQREGARIPLEGCQNVKGILPVAEPRRNQTTSSLGSRKQVCVDKISK